MGCRGSSRWCGEIDVFSARLAHFAYHARDPLLAHAEPFRAQLGVDTGTAVGAAAAVMHRRDRDADLIVTPSHLLVVLAFTKRRAWLRPLLQRFNEAEVALAWLGGRRFVMGFAARGQPLSGARPVLPEAVEVGSGSAKGCGGVWC